MAFNHAHNFAMRDPTFVIYQNHQAPSPAAILRQAQAIEALHTSATVGYISKCHPGTREEVTEDIMDWVVEAAGADHSSTPRKSTLWFSGPAGGGKTSIMRGVVDRCTTAGFSTLSFFFSIRGAGVTTVRPFIATIVHQLVALDPVLEPIIHEAVRRRPTIFEESLEFQMERLLVEPLESPAFLWRLWPRKIVIAIDGLDECREEREREYLLNLLHSLTTKLPSLIVVIIASRPEFDLRRAFALPKLNEITERIKLHEYDGSDDIRAFVCDELQEIRQSHPLAGLIPQGWMFEEFVQLLVDKSSGNFIVPVTAMKYVKHSRRNPVDSLNIIMGLLKNPSPTSKPFIELDALYTHILHPPDADVSLIRRILHMTIAILEVNKDCYVTPSFFDGFLELPPGTTATTLCDLHSILNIPESEDDEIKFHHKSLKDYLLEEERSSDLFQSPYETNLDLATRCTMHLTRWASNPVFRPPDHIWYSAWCWTNHILFCTAEQPMSACLSKVITDLDPRNTAIFYYLHADDECLFENGEHRSFHVALCSKRRCVRLCQLLTRISHWERNGKAYEEAFHGDDFEGRLNALSRFKSESGLWAPLDPDSRVVFDGKGRYRWLSNKDEDGEDEDSEDEDRWRTGDSNRSAIASRETHPSNPQYRQKSLDAEASARNVPPRNDPPPPAVFEDEDKVVQPEAGPSTLPLPDIDLGAEPTGGPAGGSARLVASSMEVHDIGTVSKKRPHDGVEANPKKKKREGNGD